MFGNKILLVNFVKLSKNKVKQKATSSLSSCHSKSPTISKQKVWESAFAKINGFAGTTLLGRNSAEFREIHKYLSYFPVEHCWKCNEKLEPKQFTCASCGALQYPRKTVNFFELLGISQMFDVDLEDLSKKFKNLQMNFHPDKFANKSPEELEISESYSSLINKAYTTLKDPLSRGFYMLELQNIKTDGNCDIEPAFLMFIMEKNEELECLNTMNSLVNFMEGNNDEMEKLIKSISENFRVNNVERARLSLMKLNYFRNLNKKIQEKQSTLTAPKSPESTQS